MELQTKISGNLDLYPRGHDARFTEIKVEFDKKKQELTAVNINIIYEGIDLSKFRDDVDVRKS